MPKKPELAAIQNYPWIKTYSTPGEGCERMPDGTYADNGFHSEMLEENLSPDGRWTDANGMAQIAAEERRRNMETAALQAQQSAAFFRARDSILQPHKFPQASQVVAVNPRKVEAGQHEGEFNRCPFWRCA